MSEIDIKELRDAEEALEEAAAVPEIPEQPAFAEEPEIPERPAFTDEQEIPEQPVFAEEPEIPEQPAFTDEPADVEAPVPPAFTEPPAQPEQPIRTEAPIRTEPPAQPEAPAKRKSPAVPILAVCLALALAAAAFLGTKCSSLSAKATELEGLNAQLTEEKEDLAKENEKLTAEVKSSAEKYQEKIKENAALGGYKSAVTGFYLDNAVIVLENDQDHYHRFGCPEIPATANYWIFNSAAAIGYGCTECPACHALSADEFCKKYIEN